LNSFIIDENQLRINYYKLNNENVNGDNILTNLISQSRQYEFKLFEEFNRRVSTNIELDGGLFIYENVNNYSFIINTNVR